MTPPYQGIEVTVLHRIDASEVGDDPQAGLTGLVPEGLDDLEVAAATVLCDAREHGMQDRLASLCFP